MTTPHHDFGPSQRPTATAMASGVARQALRDAVAALDAAESRRLPVEMSMALARVGRCYRALDALAPAEASFAQALRWAHTLGAHDPVVDLLCELCETTCELAEAEEMGGDPEVDDGRSGHAARERCRDHAFAATQLATRVADTEWEVKVLLRISAVLERCGDHDDASRLQARARKLMGEQGLSAQLDRGAAGAAGLEG